MAATFVRTNDLVAGILAASATGRALMASSFFESSTTVNDKFDAAVIQSSRLDLSTNFNFTGDVQKNGVNLATINDVTAGSAGLDAKESVRVATTGDVLSLGTGGSYNSTGGGESNGQITWTAGPTVLDGVTLANGDRILVKDQSNGDENGIYERTDADTWDRAADFNEDTEVTAMAYAFVEEGTDNANTGWVLITADPITIGTGSGTSLSFTQFAGEGTVTGGAGLAQSGNTLSIAQGGTTLTIAADQLDVNLATNGGLQDSSGVGIQLDTNPGLQLGAGGISINLDTNPGLALGAGGISVQLDTNPGLQLGASGLSLLLKNDTLAKDGSGLEVKLDPAGAITLDGGNAGIEVNVDGSTLEINTNAIRVADAGITHAKLASAVSGRLGGFDRRENFVGDGATTSYDLVNDDANGGATSGGLLVTNNGIVRLEGATEDYQFGDGTGAGSVDEINFNSAPENGANISVFYQRTGATG